MMNSAQSTGKDLQMQLQALVSCACVRACERERLLTTPWTVAHQAPLSTGVGCHFLFQGIFWLRDQTHVSCIDKWTLYHCTTWEYAASKMILTSNFYLLIKFTFQYKCFYTSFDPSWKWNAMSLMRFVIILWKIGLKSTGPIFLFWADAFNMEYTLVNFIFIVQKWY